MKKGVVTDGGLWEEGWGWLMIEVDPVGKAQHQRDTTMSPVTPCQPVLSRQSCREIKARGTCDLQIR